MIATRRQIEMPDSWEDGPEPEKRKFPRALALDVVRDLLPHLRSVCEADRLKVCGSLRRGKADVGDVELVFVPRSFVGTPEQRDLFGNVTAAAVIAFEVHAVLDELVRAGVLAKRVKKDGTATWGKWNRLAVHVASGVPVDFFGCTEAAWWNVVVCRTGGARTNTEICTAAIRKGWHWEPSPEAAGFRRQHGLATERHAVQSEREVFEFVALPYRDPEDRP